MLFLKAPQPVWQFRLSTHRSSSLVCLFIFRKEPTASLQRLKGRGGRPKKDHQGVWGPGAAGWAPHTNPPTVPGSPGAGSVGLWGQELLLHVVQQHTKPTQNKTKSFPARKRILGSGLQRWELCIRAESKQAGSQRLSSEQLKETLQSETAFVPINTSFNLYSTNFGRGQTFACSGPDPAVKTLCRMLTPQQVARLSKQLLCNAAFGRAS